MVDTFSRHRPLALLAAVVLAQVLLLAFQIKREHDIRLIRVWAVELVTPVEKGSTWFSSGVGGFWSGYIGLHNARAENNRLREEVGQLEIRNKQLETQAAEAQRLSVLLNFRESHTEAPMIAAQVIGASADPSSHTLFINRGDHDHVRRNMGVITPDGVVGKIVEVFPSTSQVLLINDKDSGVGALFETSRTHGVVKGSADPDPRMDYVVNDEKVSVGETILTSGEDRIFPKGLVIGTVSGAKASTPFQTIYVKPAARLDRLEDVLVLLSQDDITPKASGESFSVVPAPAPAAAESTDPAASTSSAASTTTSKPGTSASGSNVSSGSAKPAPSSQRTTSKTVTLPAPASRGPAPSRH